MKKLLFVLVSITTSTAIYAQSSNASLDRGKVLYEQHCLVCHQEDGSGVQNLNPPLIKTKWVLGDKTVLVNILLKGMDEEIEVNGDAYHNVMPAFDYLSDQEIADILSYVRNSFTNKASVITEGEVKAIRAKRN